MVNKVLKFLLIVENEWVCINKAFDSLNVFERISEFIYMAIFLEFVPVDLPKVSSALFEP